MVSEHGGGGETGFGGNVDLDGEEEKESSFLVCPSTTFGCPFLFWCLW